MTLTGTGQERGQDEGERQAATHQAHQAGHVVVIAAVVAVVVAAVAAVVVCGGVVVVRCASPPPPSLRLPELTKLLTDFLLTGG